jgi:hypothetical protein
MIFDSNAPGGYTFALHATTAGTIDNIALGTWDYVVLQEQSQLPSFPIDQVEAEVFPYAHELDSMILAANPCTETMFYMTWGRKNGDALNCASWPPVCTYSGMDSLLHERYMMMGADNEAEVSPVGAVWHYLRTYEPAIELYAADESHPSLAGSYAAACTFYAAIFRKDPEAITYDPGLGANAAVIRGAAKAIVYDSLSNWYIGAYTHTPVAGFTESAGAGNTIAFTNTSVDAVKYFWDFGDGNTSVETSPTHDYMASGDYTVTLEASYCGTTDIYSNVITVSDTATTAITDIQSEWQIKNPVNQSITLPSFFNEDWQAVIVDMFGREILISAIDSKINIEILPQGTYVLVLTNGQTTVAEQFIKL